MLAVDGGLVIKLPIDSIAEFHILTHTASAEFGHSTGSTTNIITRSGTNAFHGAAWEFMRNDAMDAKSFFASSVEPLKRNQFGGTLGGPIRKDKLFLFGNYEGFRQNLGLSDVTLDEDELLVDAFEATLGGISVRITAVLERTCVYVDHEGTRRLASKKDVWVEADKLPIRRRGIS